MTVSTAMVFAAGRGTRMRHLSEKRPKVLIEVAGKPLLDHALDQLRTAGIKQAVVNTHYRAEQISRHLRETTDPQITFSHERETLLETGGGIKFARPLLGEAPIATLNADAVWTGANPLATCMTMWDPERMDALLLLAPKETAAGHQGKGDFFLDNQMRPVRRGSADSAPFIYLGAQILDPALVYAHSEHVFSLNVIWDKMIANGRLFATLFEGGWCDVGQPESIPIAESLLA